MVSCTVLTKIRHVSRETKERMRIYSSKNMNFENLILYVMTIGLVGGFGCYLCYMMEDGLTAMLEKNERKRLAKIAK